MTASRGIWEKVQAIVTLLVFLGSLASLYGSYRVTLAAHDTGLAAVTQQLGEIKAEVKEMRKDVTNLQIQVGVIAEEKRGR